MRIEYDDEELRRLACVPGSESGRWEAEVVRAYRKCIQRLRAAIGETDVFAVRSLGAERLPGDRDGIISIRLTHRAWLIATLRDGDGGAVVTLRELVTITEGSRHVR